jgi:HK97 family phage portal protein
LVGCPGDYCPWDSPYWKFNIGGPVHPSRAFYGVDEALGLPALYACTRLIAESLASLPIKIYLSPPGSSVTTRYTGPSIFDQPSATGTLYDWLYQCMTSLLLHGNAWGLITGRDGYGYPTGIEWIPPDMVDVTDDPRQPWNPMRTRVYVYGRLIGDWRNELFHVKGYALPGRTEGISPLRAFALTVTSGIESARYGSDWFSHGGFPSGVFQNNELEISSEDAREIRESLIETIRGHKPLVIGRDWDYKPVSVPPSEAQFIESTQMNATQLAAIFGLPPDRVGGARGDSLTYNCVSGDTEILTQRGWLTYDQVTIKDTCLTLSTETGLAEWQPVTSVHVFDEGPYPVIKLENLAHSSVTTPDHRWPVMLSGRKRGQEGWAWKTTQTLPTDARICAAAPVVALAEAKWSDALVELVAWMWTEGWVGKSGAVTLAQSDAVNPENVARIRAALTEIFGPSASERGVSLLGSRGWQKRELIRDELARDASRGDREIARACGADAHTVRNLRQGLIGLNDNGPGWQEDRDERGLVHFRLNAQAGALLTEHAPGKVVTMRFLSQLTRAQLELFYQVSLDADGIKRPSGRGAVMAQKDKARLEAFQVACALTGRSGVIRGPNVAGMWNMSIQVTPWRKPKGHAEYVTQETADLVWCVQTPNRSWFARRNGTCYFTGNTVEQSTLQVIEALRPWLVRLENAFFSLLPANRFVRFNADALLKTDLKTRTDIYSVQRAMGLRNIDELRDLEDLPPLSGIAGGENIPLEVMVAMARSIRGIPNSMLKGITLEMDLAADRLEQLQKEGLAKPAAEPSAQAPDVLLGGMVGAARGLEDLDTEDVIRALREAAARKKAQKATVQPEFVGPWIPSEADLARLVAANGNGNGNGRAPH